MLVFEVFQDGTFALNAVNLLVGNVSNANLFSDIAFHTRPVPYNFCDTKCPLSYRKEVLPFILILLIIVILHGRISPLNSAGLSKTRDFQPCTFAFVFLGEKNGF